MTCIYLCKQHILLQSLLSAGSSGTYNRTDLKAVVAPFTLRVVALDPVTGKKLVLRSRLWVHSEDASDPYCITYLINRGWRVEGDMFTVEFAATGAASGFQCSLDRTPHVPCEYIEDSVQFACNIMPFFSLQFII